MLAKSNRVRDDVLLGCAGSQCANGDESAGTGDLARADPTVVGSFHGAYSEGSLYVCDTTPKELFTRIFLMAFVKNATKP